MSYDPTKPYVWAPDEQFILTGQEFAAVLNAIRSTLNLPQAPAILLADKANTAIDSIMAKSLEAGKIKPMGGESIMMKLDNEKETNVEES
jgi:hypothetical protein